MRVRIVVGVVLSTALCGGTVVAAPIHDAVVTRDISRVNQLIAQGVDINQRDEYGFAPLHWAVRDNQVRIARILIDAGADVNIVTGVQDGSESTPLHYAVTEDNDSLLRLLLSNGANVNQTDSNGNTPLHTASMLCSGVSVLNIVQYDDRQTTRNDAGRVPGELKPDICLLPVRLYNPSVAPPLADANDTYITDIHALRAIGLWGGAALVTPGIVIMISSIVDENFGDTVIFTDSLIDDLVFGGMVAGATSMFFTAIETAVNVDNHHLFAISWIYTVIAGGLTATTVLLDATGGLGFLTMVPAIWYAVLGAIGWTIQLDARQRIAHRIGDTDTAVGVNRTGGGIASDNGNEVATSAARRPQVIFGGSQIIVRY